MTKTSRLIESTVMEAGARIDQDRLSIVLGATALGLTLGQVVQLPARHLGLDVLGSPLGIQVSAEVLMLALVVGVVATGVHGLVRLHPSCPDGTPRHTAVHWILPGLTVLSTGIFLSTIDDLMLWALAMLGGVILLGVVISAEFASLDPAVDGQSSDRLSLTVIIYLLAAAFYVLILGTRARTLLTAPEVFVVSALLALRLFWQPAEQSGSSALYGAIVGLVLSQIVWSLNHWKLSPPSGAVILLLVFYTAAGIAKRSLMGKLSSRGLLEHAAVGLVAAALILALRG